MLVYNEAWLWLWFLTGVGMFFLARAYAVIKAPNEPVSTLRGFLAAYWVPMLIHAFVNSAFFAGLFTPGIADKVVAAIGWEGAAAWLDHVTKYAYAASLFGFLVDPITGLIVPKVPILKDLPQLPSVAVAVKVEPPPPPPPPPPPTKPNSKEGDQ